MGIIGSEIGYRILSRISPTGDTKLLDGSAYENKSKLETLLGDDVWREIKDKVVIDFGCGNGSEAIEIAERGAKKVIGLDIQENLLESARERASRNANNRAPCEFLTHTNEYADVIISLDAFEHFDDPAAILQTMRALLKPDGCVIASFGPTWYHPLGGHLFSVFPWAHLIFTEKALIRWRSDFKTDGATRFNEVAGGLNQMTIRRFERIVAESPFKFAELKCVPIRKLQPLHNQLTREFSTAIVRCKLIPRD